MINKKIKINELKCAVVIVFAFTSIIFQNQLKAQLTNSSPYSRYGIGDVYNKGLAQGFALAGTSIAIQNDTTPVFFINPSNPASYSSIRLTTAELGLNYAQLQLKNQNTTSKTHSASFSYVNLAFPIRKWWWGASIGLLPFSSVGYKVSDQQNITNVGTVDFLYEGSGGFNQAYFGNAIKPFYGLPKMFLNSKKFKLLNAKQKADGTLKTKEELIADKYRIQSILKNKKRWQELSLGINASYLFGSIDNSGRTIFPGSYLGFNTRTATIKRVNDIYFDYGAQYAFTIDSLKGRDLKDNVKIMLGATFSAQTNLNAKIDSLSYSYFVSSSGYEVGKDTVVNAQGTKGNITLPLSFGFGMGFKKGERWLVATDFAIQNWSNYQAFNQTKELKNSMRTSLGIQYVPDSKALGLNNYFKRINYRLGVRYYQTALELKSTQLNEYALSVGFGFPVGRNYILQTFSMVNIGVEFGQRGTTANGLIQENFMKATLGFTINDRWFVKPKFD